MTEKQDTNTTPRNNNNNNNLVYYTTTTRKTTSLYISERFRPTYEKLLEILERENRSVNQWFEDFATPYVRLHEPGNPQQRLDVISDLGKSYRANACFDCQGKPGYKVFLKDKPVLVCESCFERRKPHLKGWSKL